MIRWEQALTKTLLTGADREKYSIVFNLEGLLRGDYASRMQWYAVVHLNANDIRQLENLDVIPTEDGGDLYPVNGNML